MQLSFCSAMDQLAWRPDLKLYCLNDRGDDGAIIDEEVPTQRSTWPSLLKKKSGRGMRACHGATNRNLAVRSPFFAGGELVRPGRVAVADVTLDGFGLRGAGDYVVVHGVAAVAPSGEEKSE